MNEITIVIIAIITIQLLSYTVNSITISDVKSIQNDIKEAFNLLGPGSYGDPCNAKLQPCPKGDNIG